MTSGHAVAGIDSLIQIHRWRLLLIRPAHITAGKIQRLESRLELFLPDSYLLIAVDHNDKLGFRPGSSSSAEQVWHQRGYKFTGNNLWWRHESKGNYFLMQQRHISCVRPFCQLCQHMCRLLLKSPVRWPISLVSPHFTSCCFSIDCHWLNMIYCLIIRNLES